MAAKSEVSVKWVGDRQFVGVDSSKHSVVLSTQDEQNGTGMKPSDLLLVALGGCSAVDVVNILEKQRQALKGLEVRVSGVQKDEGWPRPFHAVEVEYVFRGKNLSEKAIERAIHLSHETYCSVGSTMRGVAKISSTYQIIEEE